jgi:hypothetical protein
MSDISIQASFNSGEWAPQLAARVDLQKYRSGAALLENFFVDYRGGASTRPGTKYIIQCRTSADTVRLIPFQASFNVGYILEFGQNYIRFIFDGSPVLENSFAITGATKANPCVLTIPSNNYVVGDWIFVQSIVGMTQLNDRYFIVSAVSGSSVTITDLNGAAIDSTGYTTYTSGGTAQRIYTIASPYAASDLALVKFSQSINEMILCHPSYQTQVLTLVTAIDWTLLPIVIGTTANAPTSFTTFTTLSSGSVAYSYVVTSIDSSGQESSASAPVGLTGHQDIRSYAGSNAIAWTAPAGAVAFNIYESNVSYFGVIPAGVEYGFIGTTQGTEFIDSNITPDFSQTPPVAENPFTGSGVASVAVTNPSTYTTVPSVSFTGAASTITASATAILQVQGTPTVGSGGTGYAVGNTVLFTNGVILVVASVSGGVVTAWKPVTATFSSPGSVTSGPTPANPVVQLSTSGSGTGATANLTWGVGLVQVLSSGAGYTSVPTVTFSSGSATATATLAATSNGYPSVPVFFQQRLVLAAPTGAPQTFYLSQPGNYFNFNISSPAQASDAITGTLVSGELNTIKSIVSSTAGMLLLTDQGSWVVNGGSSGSAISPSAIVANAQSFVGANDVPPIVANYDILYVQSKGAGIRDLAYNIYYNVFTGTDISVISSHLFFGYQILEWAWAEAPFYIAWAVRNDGTLLSLTYLKEQDFIGWAHHTTVGGAFASVAVVTEDTSIAGNVDAVYTVVERTVNGNAVKYIERIAERIFPNGVSSAWCVDSALSYSGSPQSSFTGAEHLAGLTCTGLADEVIIPPFVMPINGEFTIPTVASTVVVGIGYTCKLQTLALELGGQEAVQGKVKKIPFVDIRVADTLGLSIGNDFDHLTPMKDLVIGNVSSMLTGQESQVVTGLVNGDAQTYLGPAYTVPGQYCIQQANPYPASVLGVFPAFVIGDDR